MIKRKLSKRINRTIVLGSDSAHGRFTGRVLLGALLFALCLTIVGAQPSGLRIVTDSSSSRTTSISQYGITWYFDGEVEYGQFVNGDYWVIGPVTVLDVDPAPAKVNDWYVHGSMVNPPNGRQAYDSRTTHWRSGYHADYRTEFPVTIAPDASLVSTMSRSPLEEPQRPALQTAAVLTVLSEPAPLGSFRPGLIGDEKPLYNYNDIRWDRLPELPATSSVPQPAAYESAFQRPWLLHGSSWQHRHIMPIDNSPSYHQDVAKLLSRAAVLIASDSPEKDRLVTNYLQVAIDYYTMQRAPGSGAYNYFWPTVFAGIMLDDPEMRDLWIDGRNNTAEYHDDHVYFGSIRTSGSDILPVLSQSGDYELGGDTEFDEKDTWTGYYARTGRRPVFFSVGSGNTDGHEELHPSEWDSLSQNSPHTYKRMHSVAMVGFSLAASAFHAVDRIANDAYVSYTERWMFEDDDIIVDSYGSPGNTHPYATSSSTFVDEMWHAHWKQVRHD